MLLLVVGCRGVGAQDAEDQAAKIVRVKEILTKSFRAMEALHDYQGVLIKRELFGDKLVTQKIEFKFSRPFKVYTKVVEPEAGLEAIYVKGWNKNKVRAHKGSFPDVTASMNPLGRRAMDNNHRPISVFGLERMLQITARNIRRGIRRGDSTFEVSDGGVLDGEAMWRIDAKYKKGGRYITVKRDEDLWELSTRVGQGMYVILHHNDNIDSPTDIDEGDRVFVPIHYASRGEYYIAKRTFIPIKAVSWDHKGQLYESYEFSELELNPGLTQWDFDPRNTAYDFADQR